MSRLSQHVNGLFGGLRIHEQAISARKRTKSLVLKFSLTRKKQKKQKKRVAAIADVARALQDIMQCGFLRC